MSFPSEEYLRAAWLRALGKQDTHLPDSAVVCSQHFLSDDIYETESGLRAIHSGAIPSTVQVCMICLDTDSKLFLMSKHKLEQAYEKLTGYPLCDQGNLKQTLCVQCAQRLINFSRFRDKTLRAHSLMMDLVKKYELITLQHIKTVNDAKYQLKYNFVSTMLGPDHCDLHIVEHPDEDTLTELEEFVGVKKEECFDSMLIDEEMDILSEDINQADNDNDEFVTTHEVELDETQSLLKFESAAFGCTLCLAEFLYENDYNEHMNMHLQNVDGDGEYKTSHVCETCTAGSCSCDSSHPTKHKYAVQKLDDDSYPSADLVRISVANLSARPAEPTNNKKKMLPEKADTIKKRKRVYKIKDGELDNQSSDSIKINMKVNRYTNSEVKLYNVSKELKKSPISISSRDSQNIDTASKDSHCVTTSENEVPATENTRNMPNSLQNEIDSSNDYSKGNQFTCMVCPYISKYKNYLVRHMRSHTGEKPYACKLCEYRCARNSDLVVHMRTHTGEKPYSCKLCEYKSATNSRLVLHMRTHTGEKPYSCKLCEYNCARYKSLVLHMTRHTGEKPHSCKLCEYKSARNSDLVVHMRTHTGEKPYSCKLCEFKCARNKSLVLHMTTHTGEKPHSCKLCEFKFATKSRLAVHMRKHTGEKPYSCKKLRVSKCAQTGD